MQLTFAGCGDAFGSGGRFNTCFHLSYGENNILIDCGASSMVALKKLNIPISDLDGIVLSHLHGDHFGGLPFLLLDRSFSHGRTKKFTIFGPPTVKDRVFAVIDALFPKATERVFSFDIEWIEMSEGNIYDLNGLKIAPYEVIHPSGAPSHALRFEWQQKIFAFSGDTGWTETLFKVAEGADVFVCECYAYETSFPYHLNYQQIKANLDHFTCKRMILSHMSMEMLAHLNEIEVMYAEDGQQIII